MVRVSGVVWFTNLDHAKRHEDLILYKRYSPEEYPTYEKLRCDQRGQDRRNPDRLGRADGGADHVSGQAQS